MKAGIRKNAWTIIRWILLVVLFVWIVCCRYFPFMAEGYARMIFPSFSAILSAFSAIFPFSIDEIFICLAIVWLVAYVVWKRSKGVCWKRIILGELEFLIWIYVWFYVGWGLNYFRYNLYTRMQVRPVAYQEAQFHSFLKKYTEGLNESYCPQMEVEESVLKTEIQSFYQSLPIDYGLCKPKSWQVPKDFTFTPLYSGVGVLGSMGPFFAEAQLNADLLPVQYPFTYAHEFAHLLGVSNEAEANYWAYRACIESANPYLRYSGYMGLFSYVLSNVSSLLTKEQFQEWIQTIRPEVKEEYRQKNQYWRERYSDWLGQLQDWAYNLFLKGNNILSGQKNYAEVIGILLSMESIK